MPPTNRFIGQARRRLARAVRSVGRGLTPTFAARRIPARTILAAASLLTLSPTSVGAQTAAPRAPRELEFKKLAAQVTAQQSPPNEFGARSQGAALAMLDEFVLEALRGAREPDLGELNRRLTGLVTQRRAGGEGYTVVRLGGSPPVFALAANFGVSGPSAVRLYAAGPQGYQLSARIDRFSQPNFFDDYLELVPVGETLAFVTVTGRTDELSTGMFMAWRFDRGRLRNLWSSDLLPQSKYEVRPDGIEVTYCAEAEEDQPTTCRGMARDRYAWDGAVWKRVARTRLPAPAR